MIARSNLEWCIKPALSVNWGVVAEDEDGKWAHLRGEWGEIGAVHNEPSIHRNFKHQSLSLPAMAKERK